MSVVRGGVDPDIYRATFAMGGVWGPWTNFETAKFPFPPGVEVDFEPGQFPRVSISKATEGLHVVGTASGQIFHQLRNPGSVAIFRDVELVGVGQDVGYFVSVACG
ncbi:hypothetical protein [Nonomuraea sp. NEAU-A123]|uniref:hypothetical protein n=1 Tax=Nonomuraea sp. NEAU-A123 TaxID=2839649 RepID=UPI001BE46516|nr:hypothetical protein [Nonomuraea sp. NEAU-A123]MBT2225106.1 hypothetical protein [Nonomuraea sp. NEAU-A123]